MRPDADDRSGERTRRGHITRIRNVNQVFLVSPFGTKNGINFGRVERELIRPAIKAVGLTGGTTGEILNQGNIRTDMFQKLLVADLVIADISIHNANAFYELGVRHAFREKRTLLIRCGRKSLPAEAALDEVPFDLKTDRYFEYDLSDLAGSSVRLIEVLKSTLASENRDSPIFQLLPKLVEQDHEVFLTAPLEFREAVRMATANQQVEALSQLAESTNGQEWAITGLRLVGKALFDLKCPEPARVIWERIRDRLPHDSEANLLLGTLYKQLGDLPRSDLALERALESPKLTLTRRAEAHALRARNAKQRWQDAWRCAPTPEEKRTAALRSPYLEESWSEYLRGFEEDQNHFYSGLNALAMLTVITELATAHSAIWMELFDDEAAASARLADLKQRRQRLAGAVECSLEAAQHRSSRLDSPDPWLAVSLADLRCLTGNRPERVAAAYRTAVAGLKTFNLDSIRQQLLLYRQLGLLTPNVDAALALPQWSPAAKPPAL